VDGGGEAADAAVDALARRRGKRQPGFMARMSPDVEGAAWHVEHSVRDRARKQGVGVDAASK